MKEKSIKIEFWNFSYLDDYSLWAIRLNVQINVMKFACQHFPAPELDFDDYNDYVVIHDLQSGYEECDSYQATYAYPGSTFPKWLEYKTTNDYVVIDLSSGQLSHQLGFIFCFIVPKDSKRDDKLILYITISDCEGEGEKGSTKMYMNKSDSTKSDHVCVMYD